MQLTFSHHLFLFILLKNKTKKTIYKFVICNEFIPLKQLEIGLFYYFLLNLHIFTFLSMQLNSLHTKFTSYLHNCETSIIFIQQFFWCGKLNV